MLSVRLICVGKLGEKFWASACEEYQKRLSAYCKIEVIELAEQRLPENPSQGQIEAALHKESEVIRSKIPPGAALICMCVEGKMFSSTELAETFSEWTVTGISRITVIIGGSCGLSDAIKREAKLQLSMSRMTFPHHLARVMVLEQLYRALNIISGGKYHK